MIFVINISDVCSQTNIMERIRKYFPQSYTAAQIEDAVVKLCERDYRRRTDRER